jgi:hypothetical protein
LAHKIFSSHLFDQVVIYYEEELPMQYRGHIFNLANKETKTKKNAIVEEKKG